MNNRPPEAPSRWHWALLALVLILAVGLRAYRLDAQSFWNDEGNSARIAERSIPLILEGAAGDIHPPAYYLLLAGWRAIFGQGEAALRALSVVFSVLTVLLSFWVGGRLFGWWEGLLASLLVAINPFQIYYAQEARMYAMLAALATASVGLTVALLTADGRRRAIWLGVGYVLVNAVGLYTHYSFPFIILAETLVFLIWLARKNERRQWLLIWCALQVVTLALFAPWIPIALRQAGIWPTASFGASVGDTLLAFASTLAYGVTLPAQEAALGLPFLGIIAVVGLFPPIDEAASEHRLRFYESAVLLLAWMLILPGVMLFRGLTREAYLKFLLPASIALSLLVGRGIVMGYSLGRPVPGSSRLNARLLRLIALGATVVGLWPTLASWWHLTFDPAYARDDYRSLAMQIQSEAPADTAIVLDAPNQWEVFTYYYPDSSDVYPLPNAHTAWTLETIFRRYNWVYVLFWGDAEQDPTHSIEQALNAEAFRVSAEWAGGIRVVRFFVAPGPTEPVPEGAGARFGDSITLVEASLTGETLQPGEPLGVALTWQTEAALDTRYKVFVHLYAPDGTLVAQHDGEPNGDLTPTTAWQPGEGVIDRHGLLLPQSLSPGTYQLAIGLYLETGERLPVSLDGEVMGDSLALADIRVESP
jgi:mannosyltransferase